MDIRNYSEKIIFRARTYSDNWYLWLIVTIGSLISGESYRTLEGHKDYSEGIEKEKKKFYLTLRVVKKSICKETNTLRLTGTLQTESFTKDSYHTIAVGLNKEITLHKEGIELSLLQKKIIEKANETRYHFFIIVASFLETYVYEFTNNSLHRKFYYEKKSQKRYYSQREDTYEEILKMKLINFFKDIKEPIILSGPSGFKETIDYLPITKRINTLGEGRQAAKEVLMSKNFEKNFNQGYLLESFKKVVETKNFIVDKKAQDKLNNKEYIEYIFISEDLLAREEIFNLLQQYLLYHTPFFFLCDRDSEVEKQLRNFGGLLIG